MFFFFFSNPHKTRPCGPIKALFNSSSVSGLGFVPYRLLGRVNWGVGNIGSNATPLMATDTSPPPPPPTSSSRRSTSGCNASSRWRAQLGGVKMIKETRRKERGRNRGRNHGEGWMEGGGERREKMHRVLTAPHKFWL